MLFLLLNIFLLNTKLFSAEEQRFLHPINTVTEVGITREDLITETSNIAEKDKNLKYAKISLLGGSIAYLSSMIGIVSHAENKLLQRIRTIEISIEKLKQETNQLLNKSFITSLDELKSENRNRKKYILGGIIISIFSFFLSEYFYKKAKKKLKNNLEIAAAPETAALWNNLFQIENKEPLDENFFNSIVETERRERKSISKKYIF